MFSYPSYSTHYSQQSSQDSFKIMVRSYYFSAQVLETFIFPQDKSQSYMGYISSLTSSPTPHFLSLSVLTIHVSSINLTCFHVGYFALTTSKHLSLLISSPIVTFPWRPTPTFCLIRNMHSAHHPLPYPCIASSPLNIIDGTFIYYNIVHYLFHQQECKLQIIKELFVGFCYIPDSQINT